MNTYADNYRIIKSDILFTFNKTANLIIEINVDENNNNNNELLNIVFKFVKSDKKEHSISSKVSEDNSNEIIITCENFNNSLGTGLAEAMKIGDIGNRSLYLYFVGYNLFNKDIYKLEYCIYLSRCE